MGTAELILIGISLAMDAFAVSVTNGMCADERRVRGAFLCGIIFGAYQGIMPAIGYALGMGFGSIIERADHWVALILLGFIGIKMMIGSKSSDGGKQDGRLTLALVLVQGFATSVDALAVGISFAALSANIVFSSAVIAGVTFLISSAGFIVGGKFGDILNSKAEFAGGLVLLLIGLKIFVEHTFL